MQTYAKNLNNLLRRSASMIVMTTACFGMAAGTLAADVVVSGGSTYSLGSGFGDTYVVESGTTAQIIPDYDSVSDASYAGLTWSSPILTATDSCLYGGCTNSAYIQVNEGGTLIIPNPWWWMELESMIYAEGDVVFQLGSGTALLGTNYLYGDVTIEDGVQVRFGEGWIISNTYFGEDTDISIGSGSSAYFYEPHSMTNTINTISSADANALLYFNNGTMIVNGANTAASAYYGDVQIQPGATFMVGDSTHLDAVFGDPNASATTIEIYQSGGTLGVLSGYGTIYGTVTNSGIVKPGGTKGTAGTLTIHGDYSQDSTAQLVIGVAENGASALVVDGAATIDGSLIINIDGGDYENGYYTIFSASSLTGTFDAVSIRGETDDAIVGVTSDSDSYYAVVEKASSAQSFAHMAQINRYNVAMLNRALYQQIETNSPEAGSKPVTKDQVNVWLLPMGGIESVGRYGIGYSNQSYGFLGGVEYRTPWHNAVIGGAVSYLSGSMNVKHDESSADSNTYALAMYGGADLMYGRVDGTLFYSGYSTSISRDVGGTYGTTKSSPDGWSWGASFQISKSLFGDTVSPYIRGIYTRAHLDSAVESGTGVFDLSYDAINASTFAGDVGLRIHLIKPKAGVKSKLELTLAVQHDFSDKGETVTGGFASITGSSFTYHWDGDSQNTLLFGIDYARQVADRVDIFAHIDTQFSLYKRAGVISVGARYRL